jgi:predicted hotdog family 3-hydroxylacyl-ACP dehydratase
VTRIGELGTTLAVTSNRRTLVFLRSVRRLLVTASILPSLPILITLMKEALRSSAKTGYYKSHTV